MEALWAKYYAALEHGNRPRNLSNKLSEFLGVEPDAILTRAEVMQKMKAYVEANNLKDGHSIRLDSTLRDLLGDVQLNYLNMQKFLAPHYM
jgi:chromatin remodeling complex protein RSC6